MIQGNSIQLLTLRGLQYTIEHELKTEKPESTHPDMKDFAKIFVNHLKTCIHKLIHPDQFGFLKGVALIVKFVLCLILQKNYVHIKRNGKSIVLAHE